MNTPTPTSPPAEGQRGGRIVELDALRGLAALAVVGFHFSTRFEQLFGHTAALPASVPWGHYGVDLFFMLSGFVILMSLQRTTSGVRFAWGRLTRLYPAYWVAAAITFTVVTVCGLPGQEVSLGDALLNTTMLQSLLGARHIDGAYWSLQAELIFYVNMLALYKIGAWRRPAWTVIGWVAAAVAVQAAITLSADVAPAVTPLLTKLRTIASLEFIPLFGFGVLLYDASQHGAKRLTWVALAVCLAAAGAMNGAATAAVDAALATTLAMAVGGRMRWLGWRPLVWLGAVSYPLYLTHQNLGYVLITRLEAAGVSPTLAVAAAFAAALVLAGWLHEAVEAPAQRRLRRVDPTSWLAKLSWPRRVQPATAE